jgi:UDP-glucose 4-epimerase
MIVSDNRAILQHLAWKPLHADLDEIVAHAVAWERKLNRSSERTPAKSPLRVDRYG